ncbi:MAG: M20/M25/M40 family metallo-hydrolase [Longimicrobiales bacterium]
MRRSLAGGMLLAAFGTSAVLLAALPVGSFAQNDNGSSPDHRLARDIFRELIEINTTPSGSTTEAAEAMAARLVAAGFPKQDVHVVGPNARRGNLVARLRGSASAAKPLLLLAHLDVVEARREDWSMDPFTFLERGGYFYGRGTSDDKAMAAIWITNLIRLHREGVRPDRDIIVALTADEEGGDDNGVEWLLANKRPLIDAQYALNEGGGGQIRNGKRLLNAVQASEKVYLSLRLTTTHEGGHSSRPGPENAIYRLAHALSRVEKYRFAANLTEVTRAYFARMAELESGQLAGDMRGVTKSTPDAGAVERLSDVPYFNALLRTTCVATQLEGGHAENALPQMARGIVNCRILPGESPEDVQRALIAAIGDEKVEVTPIAEAKPSPPSPLVPEVIAPIEKITREMWPGVPVVPIMSTGATDGLFLRQAGIPVYGVSGLFGDIDDNRAHGRDERISVDAFYDGLEFLYRLTKSLALPVAN